MPVNCLEEKGTLRVRVEGEVDHHAAKSIMAELVRQIDAVLPRALTLDLGGVTFMDSSGIAVVLRTWRQLQSLGAGMSVCNVPKQAEKVLCAAGIDKLIRFTDE